VKKIEQVTENSVKTLVGVPYTSRCG